MVPSELADDWRDWLLIAQTLARHVEAQQWEQAAAVAEQLVSRQATLSPLGELPESARAGVLAELLSTQGLLQQLTQRVTSSKNQLQPELAVLKTRQNLLSAYKGGS